jgi:hypothetical protein
VGRVVAVGDEGVPAPVPEVVLPLPCPPRHPASKVLASINASIPLRRPHGLVCSIGVNCVIRATFIVCPMPSQSQSADYPPGSFCMNLKNKGLFTRYSLNQYAMRDFVING